MGNNKKRSRRKPGARNYADYSQEMLEVAADLVRNKIITSYEAEKQFGIPRRTIVNKSKNIHEKQFGRPTELSTEEEVHIADVVNLSAEFGCPLTLLDLRIVVYNYIQKSGKNHLFKGKMPGERWARGFLQRHNFSQRATQNIKRSRAAKTVEEMNEFYTNLETSLKDVPPSNILNFDETNLSDDPGSKKCIFKRGTKHPERVINASKSAVSIMFSGTADGHCLPPYVVYKADHLWTRWCENGPKNARYNRTKSGWFDMMCFDDWFKTIVLPWANSRDGVKLVIGDNLASHLSVETIQLCQNQNIRFVFLPKNATHLTQPLDVAFFGPMKRIWREILTNYKATYSTASTINKCHFPQLLRELMTKIDMTRETNICKGFEGSGIFPFNPSRVTLKMPTVQAENTLHFDVSLLEFLQRNRRSQPIKTGKNSKLTVVPGKSISTEEAEELAKAKKIKTDTKKTKQKEKEDSSLPGPSKTTTVKRKIKLAETQNLESIDIYELDKGAITLEDDSAELHNSSLMVKNSENLSRLCINAINVYLQPLVANHSNEFVHCLKNLPKNSKMNTPFCEDAPECLQSKIVNELNTDPEPFENPHKNKKPKIIITSNIVIKEATPEKRIVLRDIQTQINERKRRQTGTSHGQSSALKKKKKRVYVYDSDSSQTSETSFHAADDSDYENFDNYIASCLQEQEEQENNDQENRCPFGLSDIDFYVEDSPRLRENSWIIVKFASKKSVKHFIGKVLSIVDQIPTVKFARRVKNSKNAMGTVFTYPNIEDICAVHDLNDVIAVLPDPQISRRGHFIFNFVFDKYNIQ
ncbi:hypothetical protein B5X24_HaOG204541 [Helicoverpa armigera]|uniref:DDE-1 domain-containing protein n=1 Tax=Helicoverpa armigera TaxID=29058 RepID=A0A2W1BUJ3_HELAM|nr:hypothetical protein B5X24_HaOG204541 [Helicoverpa armigera]